MATIEFEKTSNGQTRYKWSTSDTSIFKINCMNAQVYQADNSSYSDSIQVRFSTGVSDMISFRLRDITTINGEAPPATVEETLLVLANEVFAG